MMSVGKKSTAQGTGQDGDIRAGLTWPIPRFEEQEVGGERFPQRLDVDDKRHTG